MKKHQAYALGRLAATCLMAAMALGAAPGRVRTDVVGSYTAHAGGHYAGKGTANVGAKSVSINIPVVDGNGRGGTLAAANLPLKDGKFSGSGRVLGTIEVSLSGRVEPPDGEVVRAARLSCTYSTSDGHSGRITAVRNP